MSYTVALAIVAPALTLWHFYTKGIRVFTRVETLVGTHDERLRALEKKLDRIMERFFAGE